MNTHCSVKLLESALDGNLPKEDEAALHQHLEECEACSAALEQMAGGQGWCREAATLLVRDKLEVAAPTRDPWSEVDFTVEHLEPADEPNMLGRLGGYDVLEIIGRGGMGVVLKGFDRELQRTVAIKVLAPHLAQNSLARKRFAREAQAAAAVVHPHVLAIHQVQPSGRLPFLVMPLVAGESLAERLKAQGTLEIKEILRIGMQAAAGLAAAHEQGLVHRDVKPANILLEMGVERAVLTDFGLARAADDVTLTRWGVIAGTPQYMSPEQARGEPLDGRSDLFSLGCVLYEMATGMSPFRSDSVMATIRRLVDDPPQAMASLNPELPPWFIALVERLLEKDPSRRFNSAQEVSELLEGCLAHVQQPASVPLPAGLPKSASCRGWRSNLSIKGVLTMIGTLGIGLLGVLLATANPPDIEGEWTGEDWGAVTLKKISDTEYTGTYTDTVGKQSSASVAGSGRSGSSGSYYLRDNMMVPGPGPGSGSSGSSSSTAGEIHLKWSRIERRFNGTWREGEERLGEISLRLVGDEIRGALTTDAKSKINPATPHLADLTWRRVVLSKSIRLRFEGVEAAPGLPYPLDNINGKIEMRVGSPDDRADRFLMVPGTMQPAGEISHVWAETSGTIAEVLVSLGQQVEAGQAMVRLNSTDEQEQVDAQQSLVRQLSANLVTLKAAPRQASKRSIDIARAELDKVRARTESARVKESYTVKLREDKVVSSGEVTTVRAELRAAEADEKIAQARLDALLEQPADRDKEIEETTAQLESAKTQLAESRKLLAACTIRSPIEGIVISLHAVPDQLVAPQSKPGAKELFEVTSTHAIDIRAQIPPDQASQIEPGQDIEVQFDHQGTTVRWTGHIVLPDPEQVGNPVVVRVANPDWRLYRAGATVTLRFKLLAAQSTSNQSGAVGRAELNAANARVRLAETRVQQRKANLQVAAAVVLRAEANLSNCERQEKLAEKEYQQARVLREQRIYNEVALEAVRIKWEAAKADIEVSRAELKAAQAKSGLAADQLNQAEQELVHVTQEPVEPGALLPPRGSQATTAVTVEPLAAPASAPRDLTGYRQHVGMGYIFQVTGPSEKELEGALIWGSDFYTDDSPLAVAAVHAGLVTPGEQQVVHVKILPGQQSYPGANRNGVHSSAYGPWPGSYRIERWPVHPLVTSLVTAVPAAVRGEIIPPPVAPPSSNRPAPDKHALSVAEAELAKARAAVELARSNAKRMAELAAHKSVDERLVDEAEARVRMAEADEKATKARLDALLAPDSEQLALAIALAELEKAQATVELAKSNADRLSELAIQRFVNKGYVDEAAARVRIAEADEKAAQARLDAVLSPESEQLALAIARVELEKARADAQLARLIVTRLEELFKTAAVTRETVINAEADARKAEAHEKMVQLRLDYLRELIGRHEKKAAGGQLDAPSPAPPGPGTDSSTNPSPATQPQPVRRTVSQQPTKREVAPYEEFTGRLVTANEAHSREGPVPSESIGVRFDMDERSYRLYQELTRAGKVKGVGGSFTAGLSDEKGLPRSGKLDRFENEFNPKIGAIGVYGILPNPDGLLLPGMSVRVRMTVGPSRAVLKLPAESLHEEQGRAHVSVVDGKNVVTRERGRQYVWVVSDKNIVERRFVRATSSAEDDGMYIIEEGLSPQDMVLVEGTEGLKPGDNIRPPPAEQQGSLVLDPNHVVRIRAQSSGEIVRIGGPPNSEKTFHYGDRVRKGELLAIVRSQDDVKRQSAKLDIRAPIDGMIVEKNCQVGDIVDPSMELFTIASLDIALLPRVIDGRGIRISFDPEKLKRAGIRASVALEMIESFCQRNQTFSLSELQNLVIIIRDEVPIKLGDVATVEVEPTKNSKKQTEGLKPGDKIGAPPEKPLPRTDSGAGRGGDQNAVVVKVPDPESVPKPEENTGPSRAQSDFAERLSHLHGIVLQANKTDAEVIEALFLVALGRQPTYSEREHSAKQLTGAVNRERGCRDILFALVNSNDFLQLHNLEKDVKEAAAFTNIISESWERTENPSN